MSDIIKDKNGDLFKSEGLAQNFIRLKKFKTPAVPVKVDDGWAVKLCEENEQIDKEVDSPVTQDVQEVKDDVTKPTVVGQIGDYDIYDEDDEETRILLGGSYVSVKNAFEIIEPYKDKRFRYKWANPKNKQGTRIKELRAQGWQVDPIMKNKIKHLSEYKDYGCSVGAETVIRGNILMRIPVHMAEQRNRKFRDMANNNLAQEQKQLEKESDGKLYGGINVSRG